MEVIIHIPEDVTQLKKIDKEIAYVYTKAATELIASLKLTPKQLDLLYEELGKEISKRKTA